MTKSTITREQLEEWVAQFDEDGGCDATDRQLEALIRQSLAAMDSEPVILYRQVNPVNGMKTYWAELDPEEFRHLKQHTDENAEFMTLYRHAQPAPVVPKSISVRQAISALESAGAVTTIGQAYKMGWNACRAAMLQASPVCTCPSGDGSLRWPCPVHTGNSPAQSDCCPEQNHVSPEQNGDTPAQSQGWIPVSERMPGPGILVLVYTPPQPGDYPGDVRIGFDYIDPDGDDPTYWFNHGENYEHFCCVACDGMTGQSEKALYTHWMPLPAAPQEVKGE